MRLKEVIKSKETIAFGFRPTPEFYRAININNKRFAKLLRGQLDPTLTELKRLSEFFGVDINDLIN